MLNPWLYSSGLELVAHRRFGVSSRRTREDIIREEYLVTELNVSQTRKVGRVVEGTGLENRQGVTPFASSNLAPSANALAFLRLMKMKGPARTPGFCGFWLPDQGSNLGPAD